MQSGLAVVELVTFLAVSSSALYQGKTKHSITTGFPILTATAHRRPKEGGNSFETGKKDTLTLYKPERDISMNLVPSEFVLDTE